jgi:uncharacterized protein Yka (UPF0111/DUF47 family)
MKSKIIERLGEAEILLPSLIREGLLANNRVKARLGILQAAARHAQDPKGEPLDLSQECLAADLDPMAMEALARRASLLQGRRVTAPGLGRLESAIFAEVETMVRAVTAGDATAGEAARRRLSQLRTKAPVNTFDVLELSWVAELIDLSQRPEDSLHRLVMDLHKALNALAAEHAQEAIAGANAYGLLGEDRPTLEAFMRGLESTKRLKFDHPGLGTTAMRAGAKLMIQNDIGETDAHVVVISVEPDAVTVTYTDVHLARAKFFTRMFGDFHFRWSGLEHEAAGALGAAFYLVTGRCLIEDKARRDSLLATIGASLVFLIDWNKARKALRAVVAKNAAIGVLEWAARHKVGHRGFLELGGQQLVSSAVHSAAATRIGFGERLDDVLGPEQAVDFLKNVLRISAEALLEGSSVRLARDRIEADLVRRLERVDAALLAIVVRQAGLAREIAAGLAELLAEWRAQRSGVGSALAARARRIDEKADRIAREAREEIMRLDANAGLGHLVNGIEDVIDELEQAAFIASLLPEQLAPELLVPLAELCAAAIRGAEAAASGIAAAAEVPNGHRIDSEDGLAAVGRLIEAEHTADEAERKVTATVLSNAFDLRTSLCVLDFARTVERATDRLAGSVISCTSMCSQSSHCE